MHWFSYDKQNCIGDISLYDKVENILFSKYLIISMIWHTSNTWDVIPWILNYARVATGSIELLKYTIKLKTHMYQMKPYFLLSNTQSSRPISRFSILQFPFFFSSYLFDRLYGVLFSATLRHMTLKLIGLSTWLWRNMLLKCVRVQSVFI